MYNPNFKEEIPQVTRDSSRSMESGQAKPTLVPDPAVSSAPLQPLSASVKLDIGSPTPLGMGLFAVCFSCLSMALMGWRGLSISQAFIGNTFFTAGSGLVIVSGWELVVGNTFGHAVFGGFGLFNLSFGCINAPSFGVLAAYEGHMDQYNNAMGFFMLFWGIFVTYFTVAAFNRSIVYVFVLGTSFLCYYLVAASYFAEADGNIAAANACRIAGGAAAFAASVSAWYALGHLFLQDALAFEFPMIPTDHLYKKKVV